MTTVQADSTVLSYLPDLNGVTLDEDVTIDETDLSLLILEAPGVEGPVSAFNSAI
jgi:hypothetical protein